MKLIPSPPKSTSILPRFKRFILYLLILVGRSLKKRIWIYKMYIYIYKSLFVKRAYVSTDEVLGNYKKLYNFQNMVTMRIIFFMCIMCITFILNFDPVKLFNLCLYKFKFASHVLFQQKSEKLYINNYKKKHNQLIDVYKNVLVQES